LNQVGVLGWTFKDLLLLHFQINKFIFNKLKKIQFMKHHLSISLLALLLIFSCNTPVSNNKNNDLTQLNVELNKPPETIDLTKKAILGKWLSIDPSKSEMFEVSLFDYPYFSEEERIAEENGTPYTGAVAVARMEGEPELKPLGTIKKFGVFSYNGNNNILWNSKYFSIPTPGKIEVYYGYSNRERFTIKFSDYNRLVVNDNFIFKRLE